MAPLAGLAQGVLEGKVVDAETDEPLAFARVSVGQAGTLTDLDGRFRLEGARPADTLRVLLVTYKPWSRPVAALAAQGTPLVVRLEALNTAPEVVIVPGENPAHRIVRLAIENRRRNDPEQRPSYALLSYNKVRVLADLGEFAGAIPDTSLLSRSDLFVWESLTERFFMRPNKVKEVVQASRMSGFQTMVVPFSPSDIQSISFYQNWVKVLGVDFLSPLASNATDRYYFYLQDTLYDGPDSVFVMQFRPRQAGYNGFDGLIGIHSRTWSLHSIEARLRAPGETPVLNTCTMRQVHRLVQDSVWFPVQLQAEMNLTEGISLSTRDTSGTTRQALVRAIIRSDFQNIRLDTALSRSLFGAVEVEVNPQAADRSLDYIAPFRPDSLTPRELNTYTTIDSLAEEANLETKMRRVRKLASGLLMVGPVDFDLYRLYNFNGVEKHRLGLGAYTNERVSRRFRVGAWAGYGTLDKELKYGGTVQVYPFADRRNRLHLAYSHDLREAALNDLPLGDTDWLHRRPGWDRTYRYFFLTRMFYTDNLKAEVYFRSAQRVTHRVALAHDRVRTAYTTFVGTQGAELPAHARYTLTTAEAEARIAPGEHYIRTLNGLGILNSRYPVLVLRVRKALNGLLGGQFDYTQLEAQLGQTHDLPGKGRLVWTLLAGTQTGTAPYSHSFDYRSIGPKSQVGQLGTFNTFAQGTFTATDYALAHAYFTFQNRTFPSVKWAPSLTLSSSAGWGRLQAGRVASAPSVLVEASPTDGLALYAPTPLAAPTQGIFESGLMLTRLIPKLKEGRSRLDFLQWLGVGVWYRYGPYAQADWRSNIAVKLAFATSLGQ
jgi:hypothetical protein